MWKTLENYRWIDFVCPISLLVAFLASAPWGRRPWSMVDCCATFTFGLGMIFIPQVVLGFQISGGKLDVAHLFLARHLGALLVGSAVAWYLCRKSNDPRMFGGLFYSRVLSCTLLLTAQAYSAYHLWNRKGAHFNDKYVMFACGGVGFWLLGSLIQLLRYKEIGGYARQSNALAAGLWFDHFVLLLVGILAFAFPSQMLKLVIKKDKAAIDGVHVCLFRCMAAMTIGHALSSYSAAGFFYEHDKKAHVIGRMTAQILAFGVNILSHFVTDLFTMYHVTPFMLTGFYITFLLTLYFRCNKKSPLDHVEHQEFVPEKQEQPADEENKDEDHDSDVGSEQDEDYGGEESDQIGESDEGDEKKSK